MENRLALVIVVDGLRASALGTYGNIIYPTPYLDALAARSLVVEWLLASSPDLSDYYEAVWHDLPNNLYESNVRSWLLTDDHLIAKRAEEGCFTEVFLYESPAKASASEVDQSHFARFFDQASEQLAQWQAEASKLNTHGLLWVHLQGLSGPWDAPLEMRSHFLDEEDPTPHPIVEPPAAIEIGEDPDELLSYQVGYGAQVQLLDSCIAGFVDTFEKTGSSAELFTMVTGSSGFALGEHRMVGHEVSQLYSEQLHLPCLVSVGNRKAPLPRVRGFVHPCDLRATLLDWLGVVDTTEDSSESLLRYLAGEEVRIRQLALAYDTAGQWMIRSPAWMLKTSSDEGTAQLFVKPDDRWEANDVASRCGEIVEQLNQLLTTCQVQGKEGLDFRKIELAEDLISPRR
ncbi:sulfatase-like hydrolase/transferase [Bythopirellula goksoeyrii]|uniref:Sulfatase n=1 Tax=Bythopirellula goksoeyrii TaxID=1400387 RepID=A0A5B9Q9B8_9BACT|nr:sulfatase-like hydrolase/transferase [Bythopirellula goksoeyrii]QEG35634.1 Sulfatase [Bythopirellula goksoeyrii]